MGFALTAAIKYPKQGSRLCRAQDAVLRAKKNKKTRAEDKGRKSQQ